MLPTLLSAARAVIAHKSPLRNGPEATTSRYLGSAIPFAACAHPPGVDSVEMVDPTLVAGSPWQGYAPPPTAGVAKGLMDDLDEGALAVKSGRPKGYHAAEYIRLGALPIYVAREGKNRVDLYREYKRPIAALVRVTPYPEPSSLVLHRVKLTNSIVVECTDPTFEHQSSCNQTGPRRVIAFPKIVVPLLEAYGARWGQDIWGLTAPHRQRREEAFAVAG